MAAILKQASADPSGIRSLSVPDAPATVAEIAVDPRAEELTALHGEIARLTAERAQAAIQAERIAARHKDALAAVRDEGFRDGLAAADRRENERLEALRTGLADEALRFGDRLAALDTLAVAIARAALDKIFARSDAMDEMVAAALSRHLATITDHSLLAVRVSADDFPDPATLERAMRAIGRPVSVTSDDMLPPGACQIAARLGHVDLDIPAQRAALFALLDTMAAA